MSILRSALRSFGNRAVVAPVRSSRLAAVRFSSTTSKTEEHLGDGYVPEHYQRPEIYGNYQQTEEEINSFSNHGQDFPTAVLNTEEELAPDEPSAISFWGKPALLGSLGVIALSKELVVLNCEVLVLGATVFGIGTYFIVLDEIVRTQAAMKAQGQHDLLWERMLREKESLQKVIDAKKNTLSLQGATERFFDYQENLRDRLFQARTHQKHKTAADAILAEFQAAVAKESAGDGVEKKVIAEGATKFALSEFKANPKTKEQVILEGLALMDGSGSGQQKDQIGGLFDKFVANYEAEQKPIREAAAKEAAKKAVSKAEYKKIVEETRSAQQSVYKK